MTVAFAFPGSATFRLQGCNSFGQVSCLSTLVRNPVCIHASVSSSKQFFHLKVPGKSFLYARKSQRERVLFSSGVRITALGAYDEPDDDGVPSEVEARLYDAFKNALQGKTPKDARLETATLATKKPVVSKSVPRSEFEAALLSGALAPSRYSVPKRKRASAEKTETQDIKTLAPASSKSVPPSSNSLPQSKQSNQSLSSPQKPTTSSSSKKLPLNQQQKSSSSSVSRSLQASSSPSNKSSSPSLHPSSPPISALKSSPPSSSSLTSSSSPSPSPSSPISWPSPSETISSTSPLPYIPEYYAEQGISWFKKTEPKTKVPITFESFESPDEVENMEKELERLLGSRRPNVKKVEGGRDPWKEWEEELEMKSEEEEYFTTLQAAWAEQRKKEKELELARLAWQKKHALKLASSSDPSPHEKELVLEEVDEDEEIEQLLREGLATLPASQRRSPSPPARKSGPSSKKPTARSSTLKAIPRAPTPLDLVAPILMNQSQPSWSKPSSPKPPISPQPVPSSSPAPRMVRQSPPPRTPSPVAIPDVDGRLVWNHSTHVTGLIDVLKRLVDEPGIGTVTPAVLSTSKGRSESFMLKVSVAIKGGFKLICRHGRSVQEVFIVTPLSREDLEAAVSRAIQRTR